ncbi:hypothetical protein [Rhizobium leucaenae]|uniref:hypothetical protein n=1 Tax=Rhizobium leucaenae TaxID=29450 RepID=UPI00160F7DA2|nr:hypothetical protein [Rhizobium leucaenae]MBB6299423.1 imidazoleglycerol phosphate dehydratase HisB [Rhizobium leucaenae]
MSVPALIPLDTLGATIRAHVDKGDASIEKAEQHYKAAGIHLAEAKDRVKQTPGLTWPRFLTEHCQIRRARADELIMIADGRTTLADLRMKKAESVRAVRQRQKEDLPLRSGGSVPAITETEETSVTYKRLHPMDPLNEPVEKLLPTDLTARAWAYSLATMKVETADHMTYKALHEAFARLVPNLRMRIMVEWFASMSDPEQREFHDRCPTPALPEYMGDWMVETLLSAVNYRPDVEVTEAVKERMAFDEMDKVMEIYRAWPAEKRAKYEALHDPEPDFIPQFLKSA